MSSVATTSFNERLSEGQQARDGLRIASWNAYSLRSRQADLMDPTNDALCTADILCLQECRAGSKEGDIVTGSQASRLLSHIWTPHSDAVLTFDCGIVCRIPHLALNVLFTSARAVLAKIEFE